MHMKLNQNQDRSKDTPGSRSPHTEGVHQYLDRDKLRARLTEYLANTAREPRRHTEKRFAQGSAAAVCRTTGQQRR